MGDSGVQDCLSQAIDGDGIFQHKRADVFSSSFLLFGQIAQVVLGKLVFGLSAWAQSRCCTVTEVVVSNKFSGNTGATL